jgi:hypothetical protein
MKNPTKIIRAVLAIGFITCALFSQQAQAMPMPSGTIRFGGSVMYGTGGSSAVAFATSGSNGLATAKEVVDWLSSNVTSSSGDFSNIPSGTSVTMAETWTFNPSTPTPSLWSVNGFTFDLLTSTIVSQSAGRLEIRGIGIIRGGEEFSPTVGAWTFISTDPGGAFGFTSSTTALPDSGTTATLLALALMGVLVLRRELKAAQ